MKILFAISLLAICAAVAFAWMTRSTYIETRTERDRINRDIVGVHEGVTKVNAETDSTWKIDHNTLVEAKDEASAAAKLGRETTELEDTLKQLKKDIEDIVNKRTSMQDEIKRIIGKDGTPEEVIAKVDALWRKLFTTQVTQFITDNPRADLELYGLLPPEAEVSFLVGAGDQYSVQSSVQFGKSPTNDPGSVFATASTPPTSSSSPGRPWMPCKFPTAMFATCTSSPSPPRSWTSSKSSPPTNSPVLPCAARPMAPG